MKYGDTLRQRSIPAWGHYNIDYDDIKHLIKEHTTPGNGKAVSIPGQGSVSESKFEDLLYAIFCEQHQRIELFVKSKTGEIERRLDHLSQQLQRLRSSEQSNCSGVVPAKKLARYARIEEDTVKTGEEIRSLSRFVGAQRLGFSKLLKKYKKWTRSSGLERRLKEDILGKPGCLSKENLGYLLDHYTDLLQEVRSTIRSPAPFTTPKHTLSSGAITLQQREPSAAVISRIQAAVENGLDVDFDTTFATLPRGDKGSRAVYWVHIDHLVELQVLLLQKFRLYMSRTRVGRSYSSASSQVPSWKSSVSRNDSQQEKDDCYGFCIVDDEDAFAHKQSSSTISDTEDAVELNSRGSGSARWNSTQDANIIVDTTPNGAPKKMNAAVMAKVKRKHLPAFLNTSTPFPGRRPSTAISEDGSVASENDGAIDHVRTWLSEHDKVKPLAGVCAKRMRFVGLEIDQTHGQWATLDQSIFMKRSLADQLADNDWSITARKESFSFPHAVLEVRQEGQYMEDLVQLLDKSHLVERVRGFSLETHAVWVCCKPRSMTSPYWMPLLKRDIRKVPDNARVPPRRRMSAIANSPEPALSRPPSRSTSMMDNSSSTLMGQGSTPLSSPPATDDFQPPSRQAFKEKRKRSALRREHPLSKDTTASGPGGAQNRYWSEYDHPESGDEEDGYYIYVDPNASIKFPGQEVIEVVYGKFKSLLKPMSSRANETVISPDRAWSDGDESATSSDESPLLYRTQYGTATVPRPQRGKRKTLRFPWDTPENTKAPQHSLADELIFQHQARERLKLHIYVASVIVSLTVLSFGAILAATGRKRLRGEVDAGVLLSVVVSATSAAIGVGTMVSRQDRLSWWHRGAMLVVVSALSMADAALLAWVLT
ncbi:hypothetical protein K402DRAFT_85123 [Aulographum hederae CBS 113979]|uniref:SPX domain-containing protein n=1 Tax=Aulographum hederae CBS 113979 TaxID=1176131 RepID=A0A6G1H0X4_9PEZI|nr:hypothetical protein K402DRAFT_85123 [Aulographum hederae CBS 113979]